MIGVDVFGRLGNQMFQYAFAYTTTKKLKTNFFIDDFTFPFCLHEFFILDRFSIIRNRINRKLFKIFIKKDKIKITNNFNIYAKKPIIKNYNHYWGYFQSELYFKEYKQDIKTIFTIKDAWKKLFIEEYGNILANNKTLAIHFRRTDYLDQNNQLPWEYYNNALNKIGDLSNYYILVVGDDLQFAKDKLVTRSFDNINYCENNQIIDFQIIQNADVAIISNSSFAWWASYLSPKKKITYAPEYWLGKKKEYPIGITSTDFIWTNF